MTRKCCQTEEAIDHAFWCPEQPPPTSDYLTARGKISEQLEALRIPDPMQRPCCDSQWNTAHEPGCTQKPTPENAPDYGGLTFPTGPSPFLGVAKHNAAAGEGVEVDVPDYRTAFGEALKKHRPTVLEPSAEDQTPIQLKPYSQFWRTIRDAVNTHGLDTALNLSDSVVAAYILSSLRSLAVLPDREARSAQTNANSTLCVCGQQAVPNDRKYVVDGHMVHMVVGRCHSATEMTDV